MLSLKHGIVRRDGLSSSSKIKNLGGDDGLITT